MFNWERDRDEWNDVDSGWECDWEEEFQKHIKLLSFIEELKQEKIPWEEGF